MIIPGAGAHSCGAAASISLIIVLAASGGAASAVESQAAVPDSPADSTAVPTMPVFEMSADATQLGIPALPERGGSCYVYRDYVVVAWGSPDPEPVAIVRTRDSADTVADCTPDSLPGNFVVWNDWAECFAGMWHDHLFIDSGTCDIRALIIYDVPARRQIGLLEGLGETEGWLDDVTVRIWMLASTDAPRSLCPDIPEMFSVGVDSLYALNLDTLSLRPLGPWRCHPLQ